MNNSDIISVKGKLNIELRNQDNELIQSININNLVVSSGQAWIISRMSGVNSPLMSHMAIGSNSNTPILSQTTLSQQLARVSLLSTTIRDNTITYTGHFPAGVGVGSITEAGIFNSAVGGTMLARTTFGVLTKDVRDSITIIWTITIT